MREATPVRPGRLREQPHGRHVLPRRYAHGRRPYDDSDPLLGRGSEASGSVARTAAAYGNPDVRTRAGYARSSADGIDRTPALVRAPPALAVPIAPLGIAKTLLLARHERTGEMGLL
ncbi:hypothetical protein GCM10010433_67070 [Streptomyces pulveraceus]|uniref:hypothetical protein n=1 Tax=Streptomyces pulveraceus TaxID=68258 RepID=UPI00338CEC4F